MKALMRLAQLGSLLLLFTLSAPGLCADDGCPGYFICVQPEECDEEEIVCEEGTCRQEGECTTGICNIDPSLRLVWCGKEVEPH